MSFPSASESAKDYLAYWYKHNEVKEEVCNLADKLPSNQCLIQETDTELDHLPVQPSGKAQIALFLEKYNDGRAVKEMPWQKVYDLLMQYTRVIKDDAYVKSLESTYELYDKANSLLYELYRRVCIKDAEDKAELEGKNRHLLSILQEREHILEDRENQIYNLKELNKKLTERLKQMQQAATTGHCIV